MNAINGVTLEDWTSACANLAGGMSLEEVCRILGIAEPFWEQTNMLWGEKINSIIAQDQEAAMRYSEMFTNPKLGKFANIKSNVKSLEEVLSVAPDFDTFQKIFWHSGVAFHYGYSPEEVVGSYGLDLLGWSQISVHYTKWYNEYVLSQYQSSPDTYNERLNETNLVSSKWQQYFEEYYKKHTPQY